MNDQTSPVVASISEIKGVIQSLGDEDHPEIEAFLTRLRDTQEPLGEVFEQVLYDNLWDLYER